MMYHKIPLSLARATKAIFLVACLAIISLLGATPTLAQTVNVELRDVQNRVVGQATLTQTESGVKIKINVRGMEPVAGDHGTHIHAIGLCDAPDFKSSGGHYNASGVEHPTHAGDLPNMMFYADGSGEYETTTDRFFLSDLYDEDGSALVIHAGPDDFASQPSGKSGSRIICGVIAAPTSP